MSDRKSYEDQVEQLFNRVVDELQGASDEEVLAGESPDSAKEHGLALLQRARATAGKLRLASARGALSASTRIAPAPSVTVEAARAYIRQAANDPRYTLAARQLNEMSDDDVLAIYVQLLELEQNKPE
jgi:hypothetical protein